ncbi:MAG: hypothetical protein ABI209_03655, partial [Edaphobacter sp.]
EIYALPALTSKDESDIKLARSLDPPENNLPVHFSDPSLNSSTAAANPTTPQPTLQSAVPVAVTQPEPPPASVSQPTQSNQSAAPASEAAKPPLDTPASATQSGDPAPEKHRAPPTLYTLPTDKTPAAQQNPKQTPQ